MPFLSVDTGSSILTILFIAVILISALLCALFRRKQKLIPALVLLGVTLLTVVIAALLSRVFVNMCGSLLQRLLTPILDEEVQGWLEHLPTGAAGIGAALGLLAVPLVFVILFILICLILRIVAGIVLRIFFKKDKPFRLPGFLIGLANGVVIGLVLLVPLTCLLTSVGGIAGSFFDTGADRSSLIQDALGETTTVRIRNSVDEVNDNFMLKTVNTLAGKPVMSMIGSPKIEVGGEGGARTVAFNLNDLLGSFAETAGYAFIAVDDVGTYQETHEMTDGIKASIDRAFDSAVQSEWLTQTLAEGVSSISKSWRNGEDFYSLACPETADFLQPSVNKLLDILSTETGGLLVADLSTVKQILYMLCDNGLIMDDHTVDEVMDKMYNDGLLDSMLTLIEQNEHLKPLAGEYEGLGFRILSHVLGKDALESGTYDEALDEIVPALNDVLDQSPEEREPAIREAVQTALADYDIDVPDELAVSVAEEIIATAGADGEITRDEVLDFLVSYYGVSADIAEDSIP